MKKTDIIVDKYRSCHTVDMDEDLAERLLDYAIYLACSDTDEPGEEVISSIMGWLVHTMESSTYGFVH